MTTYQPGATTLTREGDIWTLTLTGEHDLTTAKQLDEQMEHIAASGTSVVIDLTQAQFIDSQVIAWLLRWWERSLENTQLHLAISIGQGTTPHTTAPTRRHRRHLPCHPTTADALHHLQTG